MKTPEERRRLRDELVQECFPDPPAQQCLNELEQLIAGALTCASPTRGSNRTAALTAASKNAKKLASGLEKLDLYTLVSAMGSFEGPPVAGSDPPRVWSLMLQRIAEWRDFGHRPARLSTALENLSKREPRVRRGAPTINDPVTFGVAAIGSIWKQFRPKAPLTGSMKEGKFGDFVRAFLSAPPLDFPDTEIGTAVRYYIEKEPAAVTEEEDRSSPPQAA